jgi:hypothetical protein
MLAGSLATVLAKPLQVFRELSAATSLAELEDMVEWYSYSSLAATRIAQEVEVICSVSVCWTCILLYGLKAAALVSTRFKKCDMLCFC